MAANLWLTDFNIAPNPYSWFVFLLVLSSLLALEAAPSAWWFVLCNLSCLISKVLWLWFLLLLCTRYLPSEHEICFLLSCDICSFWTYLKTPHVCKLWMLVTTCCRLVHAHAQFPHQQGPSTIHPTPAAQRPTAPNSPLHVCRVTHAGLASSDSTCQQLTQTPVSNIAIFPHLCT